MSKSFGGSSRAMGGGGRGGGGGSMLRTVQRALRASSVGGGGSAAQEPFSNSTSTKTSRTITSNNNFNNTSSSTISLASSSSSQSPFTNLNLPISVTSPAPSWASSSAYTDESDWEYCLDGVEDHERINIFFDDHILGPVPSTDEVHHAVSALQQVHEPAYFSYFNKDGLGYNSIADTADEVTSPISLTRQVSSNGSVSDWIEPSLHIYNSKLLQPYGSDRVYDAFHLLRTEPSIQRMVISLSSDKAVWDAVLNNEVVREMRDSLRQADNSLPGTSGEGSDKSDGTTDIFNWTFVNTKAKVMEMIDKIIEFVKEWFQPPEMEKTSEGNTYQFDENLRTPFFLSVVVLLIVIVARAQNA